MPIFAQGVTKDKLTKKFDALMSDKENIKNKISDATEKLCESARENAELFIDAMEF